MKIQFFKKNVLTYNNYNLNIMIENLIQTIKGELAGNLAGKINLDQEKAMVASGTVTNTIKDEIAGKAEKGQFDDIVALLGKGGASTGFANNIINKVIKNLSSRVGLSQNVANQIATFAVPFVINKLGSLTSSAGKDNREGIQEMLGDLMKGSLKDKFMGGLGKKFGF